MVELWQMRHNVGKYKVMHSEAKKNPKYKYILLLSELVVTDHERDHYDSD